MVPVAANVKVPISIDNAQSVGTGTYEQSILVDSSTYSTYINANWSNVWFTYLNGTTIPAWIENNPSNTAASTMVWIQLFDIPALTTEVVDMDIGPTNYHGLSAAGPTGEAPQLSGTYAELDNGAQVFPLYDNFKGTVLNTTLWDDSSSFKTTNGHAYVDNGLSFYAKGAGDYVYIAANPLMNSPMVTEMLFDPNSNSTSGIYPVLGETTTLTKSSAQGLCPGYQAQWIINSALSTQMVADTTCSASTVVGSGWTNPTSDTVVGFAWPQTGIEQEYQNYVLEKQTTDSTLPFAPYHPFLGLNKVAIGTYYVQWVRARAYPPNGAMPTTTFNPALFPPGTPTVSAVNLDSDQVLNVTDKTPTSGTAPFQWEWLVSVNSGAFTEATACGAYQGSSAANNTAEPCSIPAGQLTASDYYQFEFSVNDSTGTNFVSANSPTVSVYPPLTVSAPTVSATLLDLGQSTTLTPHASGGTPALTVTWYVGGSATCSSDTSVVIVQGTPLTISPSSSGYYCYSAADSATNPENHSSSTMYITVNPALVAGPITPASPFILSGQTVTLTANPQGGSPAYSFQWVSGSSATCASDTTIAGATGSQYNASAASNTYYCYTLSDRSNGTPSSATVSVADLVTVTTVPAVPGTPSASRPSVDAGQNVSFVSTGSSGGGSGNDTYIWYGLPPGCPTADVLNITCAPTTPGNYTINITVTDSAGYTVGSGYLLYEVYADPATNTPNPSVGSVDLGQNVTFNVTGRGGFGLRNYTWQTPAGLGCPVTYVASITCTPTQTGVNFTVSVAVTDQNGFTSNYSVSANYTVFPDPRIGAPTPSVTKPSLGQTVNFVAKVTQAGSGNDTFSWTPSAAGLGCQASSNLTLTCNPVATGTYTVSITVTDSNGGSNTSTSPVVTVVSTSTGPVITAFTASPDPVVVGSTTNLNVSSTGGVGTLAYYYTGLPAGCGTKNVRALPCAPSATGNFTVVVYVNDSAGHSSKANTSLQVIPQVTTPSLASVSINPSLKVLAPLTASSFQAVPACLGGACPSSGISYLWSLRPKTMGTLNSTLFAKTTLTAGTTTGNATLEVSATYLGKTKTFNATVEIQTPATPTLISVAETPQWANLTPGTSQTFHASAVCTPNPCTSYNVVYAWKLSDPSMGTLSTLTGNTTQFTAGNTSGPVNLTLTVSLGTRSLTKTAAIQVLPTNTTSPTTQSTPLTTYLVLLVVLVAIVLLVLVLALRRRKKDVPSSGLVAGGPSPGVAMGAPAFATGAAAKPEWEEEPEPGEDVITTSPVSEPPSPAPEVAAPPEPSDSSEELSTPPSPEPTPAPATEGEDAAPAVTMETPPPESPPSPEEDAPGPSQEEVDKLFSQGEFRKFKKELRRLRKKRDSLAGSSTVAAGTASEGSEAPAEEPKTSSEEEATDAPPENPPASTDAPAEAPEDTGSAPDAPPETDDSEDSK